MTLRGNDQLHFMDKKTEAQMAKTDFGALLRSQWPIQDLNPSPPQPPWSLRVGASQLEESKRPLLGQPSYFTLPSHPSPCGGRAHSPEGWRGLAISSLVLNGWPGSGVWAGQRALCSQEGLAFGC